MEKDDFMKAMEIISANHTTEMYINKPYNSHVGDLGTTEFSIRIKKCCANVVDNLKKEGYSLSMEDGLMSLSKF